jgi:hypothetical protein
VRRGEGLRSDYSFIAVYVQQLIQGRIQLGVGYDMRLRLLHFDQIINREGHFWRRCGFTRANHAA